MRLEIRISSQASVEISGNKYYSYILKISFKLKTVEFAHVNGVLLYYPYSISNYTPNQVCKAKYEKLYYTQLTFNINDRKISLFQLFSFISRPGNWAYKCSSVHLYN